MAFDLTVSNIRQNIFLFRGCRVILDNHLAQLYEVETGALNRAVKRNRSRFPDDFRFQLLKHEVQTLEERCHGGRRSPPFAYTQEGVAALSCILSTDRAIEVNTAIMRAYVQVNKEAENIGQIAQKLDRMDNQIKQILELVLPKNLQEQTTLRIEQNFSQRYREDEIKKAELIKTLVGQYFNIRPSTLNQRTRTKNVVLPRQVALYLIRKHTDWSLKELAQHFDLKDHTTVLHACNRIAAMNSESDAISTALKAIEMKLSANF